MDMSTHSSSVETLHYAATDYEKSLLIHLNRQRLAKEFCDITLIIDRTEYVAHKAVLSAASPYFHAMFGGNMTESQKSTVAIQEIDSNVFDRLLEYIYSGKIVISEKNCQDVFSAASMLQLHGAMEACVTFLIQQLHPSNAIGIYQFADRLGCKTLRNASERYIYSHFVSVTEDEEYSDIPVETLIYLLRSEKLQVENEFQVFELAMKWILVDVSKRRKNVFDIIYPIRFPIISPVQLDQYIESCPDLSLKIALRKTAHDFQQVRFLTESRVRPYLFVPRRCARKCVYVIGGYSRAEGGRWSDSHSLRTAECFYTYSEEWRTLAPMQHKRSGHGVCTLRGRLYTIGGENDSLIFDSAECFDPGENTWQFVAPMTVPRCGLGVAVVNEEIYALGGWVGSEIGNTIEKYNPDEDEWKQVGVVQTLRFSSGVIEFEDEIYVLGGICDQGTELSKVEKYNPATDEWHTLATMSTPRAYVGLATLGEHLYAVGGWNDESGALDSVERYNVRKDIWETISSMRHTRASASVTAVNGLLYAIGGRRSFPDPTTAPTTRDTVEVYDPQTGTWAETRAMLRGRCEAGVAVI